MIVAHDHNKTTWQIIQGQSQGGQLEGGEAKSSRKEANFGHAPILDPPLLYSIDKLAQSWYQVNHW